MDRITHNYPHWSNRGFIKWELIRTALNMRKHTVSMEETWTYTTWGEGSLSPLFTRWKIHPRWLGMGFLPSKSTKKNSLWTWTVTSVYYIISILPSPWSWWSYQLCLPAILDFRKKNFTKYAECMEYLPWPKIWPLHKFYGSHKVGEYSIHAVLQKTPRIFPSVSIGTLDIQSYLLRMWLIDMFLRSKMWI